MLNIDLAEGVSEATRSDWRKVADITAEAFAEDPVNQWLFGNPLAIRSCFRVLSRELYSKHGICHLAGDDGAAMWIHSDAMVPLPKMAELALALGLARHATKGALKRAMQGAERMERHHPKDPHLYLFTIGVTRAARGTGRGHALLAPVLEACDRADLPCYLENSNPDNFGFYSAHGFEHKEHFAVGDGGPPLQAMWRAPVKPI